MLSSSTLEIFQHANFKPTRKTLSTCFVVVFIYCNPSVDKGRGRRLALAEKLCCQYITKLVGWQFASASGLAVDRLPRQRHLLQ